MKFAVGKDVLVMIPNLKTIIIMNCRLTKINPKKHICMAKTVTTVKIRNFETLENVHVKKIYIHIYTDFWEFSEKKTSSSFNN